MTNYYQTLGITHRATLTEIKAAYRKMARLYHPDVSKDPEAEDKFVEINEAYEYLINRRTGKVYSEPQKKYQPPPQPVKTHEEWIREQQQEARERARRHAQMKYRAFKNSSYYKNEMALEIIGDNFMFYSLVAFTIIPAIVGLSFDSFYGFFLSGIIGFIGRPVWEGAQKEESNIRLSLLFSAIFRILNSKVFKLFVMIAINLFIFIKVVMHTLIPLGITFILLLASIAAGYALVRTSKRIKKNAYTRSLYGFVIVPALYQSLFVINFVFATNATTETYRYRLHTTKYQYGNNKKPSVDDTPILKLENDAYERYVGIRFLWRPEQIRFGSYIEYHFAEGLLGIRVMRSYNIINYTDYPGNSLPQRTSE